MVLMISFGLAVLGLVISMRHGRRSNQGTGGRNQVLVARRYIPAFTPLRADDVVEQEYPGMLVPPGALQSVQELSKETARGVLAAMVAIPEGHPITHAILVEATREATLSAWVGPGQTAVAVEVDRAHGAGGWVRPGDTVAIYGGAGHARRLIPAIRVLAVNGNRLGQTPEGPKPAAAESGSAQEFLMDSGTQVITLLAGAREADLLLEAKETGSLTVALRGAEEGWLWTAEK